MDQKLLHEFEALCLQEEAPACQSMCPVHVDARAFINFLLEGKNTKARQLLDKALPLSCLTAFLCEGNCKESCRRAEVDEGVNISMLEKFCVLNTPLPKLMPFPSTGKKIAIIGGALSSLIVAHELNKKGHKTTIFHSQELAFDLIHKEKGKLPENALQNALDILKNLKVSLVELSEIDENFILSLKEEFEAVYIGCDDSHIAREPFFSKEEYGTEALTLLTKIDKILLGGREEKYIQCIADAKKATASIERILQNVNPASTREKEGVYKTRLYTNLEGIIKKEIAIPQNPYEPTQEEALKEAARCINCACLECVKQCSFLAKYKSYPKRYLREIYNNLSIVQGSRQTNTMANSCTQCGLCAKVCPQGLDMGKFLDIARQEMVQGKRMPPSAHEFALEDMFFSQSDEVQFIRLDNTNKHLQEESSYMFFPGCQLPATLPKQVIAAYEHLRRHLKNPVGFHLSCCGIPAQWAGNTKYLQYSIDSFMQKWKEKGKPIYIFACASCAEFFKKNCPGVEQISLCEVLSTLPLPSHIERANKIMAIHDPCSSRDFPATQEGVRKYLSLLKQKYSELDFGRENTRCCGFGGLADEVSPDIAQSFSLKRKEETEEALLVYCAICRERFQKIEKDCLHILELAFPHTDMDIEISSKKGFLKIYERQDNRLSFRKEFLKHCFGEEEENMIDENTSIILEISPEVEEILDERHILRSDILKVLNAKEKDEECSLLYNAAENHFLVAYRPRQVTFWIKYKQGKDNSYTILDAYSHRMIVPGVKGEGDLPKFQICCEENS